MWKYRDAVRVTVGVIGPRHFAGAVGMRSRASRRRLSDNDLRCNASDRRWFPARPGQHVHRRRNHGKGRIPSALASAHGRNGKRRVETSSAGPPERIDHRRRCTRHDHRTCCRGSRGSASRATRCENASKWATPDRAVILDSSGPMKREGSGLSIRISRAIKSC
jgi:hypothetical protein